MYSHRTVRVIQGVEVEHSPTKKLDEVDQIPSGIAPGRFQYARPGSYALVEGLSLPTSGDGLKVCLHFQAHLPKAGHPQAIISTLNIATNTGFAVVITETGLLEVWLGVGDRVEIIQTGFHSARQRWVRLDLIIKSMECSINFQPLPYILEKAAPASATHVVLSSPTFLATSASRNILLFAATYAESSTSSSTRPTHFFNGRIDSPTIYKLQGATTTTVAKYDFSSNIPEDTILDVSGNNFHGVLINAPTRAVTGYGLGR